MSEKNTTTAAKARKGTQLSTTVSPEVYEALREHRFDKRIEKMTDIVAEAISDYLVKNNIQVKSAGAADNTPAAGNPAPKA